MMNKNQIMILLRLKNLKNNRMKNNKFRNKFQNKKLNRNLVVKKIQLIGMINLI